MSIQDAPMTRTFVELVVASPVHAAADLVRMFGEPDRSADGGRAVRDVNGDLIHVTQSAWIVESNADRCASVEIHLEAVAVKLEPHLVRLRSQVTDPLSTVLRIVRHLDGSHHQGHGFVLDRSWITLLAELHGVVDLDQYVATDAVP